jgi:hypothetical protein
MNKGKSNQEMFYELSYYTITHHDPIFIHQHAVDAFTAQNADENTKPIAITFALIGLYLFIEKGFSGKEVQNAHVKLGKYRKKWPKFNLPRYRGDITISDVINIPKGPKRDRMIIKWCISVWKAYRGSHEKVDYLVRTELWK